MSIRDVNWNDCRSVVTFAISLHSKTKQLIFLNGRNFQITHETRREYLRSMGFTTVKVVEPGATADG